MVLGRQAASSPLLLSGAGSWREGLPSPAVPGRIPGLRFLGWLLGFSASLHGRSWNNSEKFCTACKGRFSLASPASHLPFHPQPPQRSTTNISRPQLGEGCGSRPQTQRARSWWYLELLLKDVALALGLSSLEAADVAGDALHWDPSAAAEQAFEQHLVQEGILLLRGDTGQCTVWSSSTDSPGTPEHRH